MKKKKEKTGDSKSGRRLPIGVFFSGEIRARSGLLGPLGVLGPPIRIPFSLEIGHRPLPSLLLSDFSEIEPQTPPCLHRDCSLTKSPEVKVSFPPFPFFLPLLFVLLCAAAGNKSRRFPVGERDLCFGLFPMDFSGTDDRNRSPATLLHDRGSGPCRPSASTATAVA